MQTTPGGDQQNSQTNYLLQLISINTKVGVLQLEKFNISALPPGIFLSCATLTKINLANNRLTSILPGLFDCLTNLVSLQLQSNRISKSRKVPVGLFDKLRNLTHLDLSDNNIADLPVLIFEPLMSLKTLFIQDNPLSFLPPINSECPLEDLKLNLHLRRMYRHKRFRAPNHHTRSLINHDKWKKFYIHTLMKDKDIISFSKNTVIDLQQLSADLPDGEDPELYSLYESVRELNCGLAFVRKDERGFADSTSFANYVFFVRPESTLVFSFDQINNNSVFGRDFNSTVVPFPEGQLISSLKAAFRRLTKQMQPFEEAFAEAKSTRLLVLGNGGAGKTALLNKLRQKKILLDNRSRSNHINNWI